MALTTKRIIALPAQTDPQEGDYLAIDNATSGTHKIPAGRIGVEVDDTLTEAGKAADAKAVGDALDEIRSQIEVTGTASGAIATFTDGSDAPMKSCMVSIVPKQSGTGTPSPDNVRPISGWESVNLYDTGKNLFDQDAVFGGLGFVHEADGSWYVANPSSVSSGAVLWENAEYTGQMVLRYTRKTINATGSQGGRFKWLYTDGTSTSIYADNSTTYVELTNTSREGKVVKSLVWDYGSSANSTWFKDVQLELGTTATAYEPYNGTTTTVNLGRTVYGGTLDVVSGVLTVDRAMLTLDGTSNITQRRAGTSNSLFGIDLASGQGGKAVAETSLPNVIANELPLETAYNAWRNETPLVAMMSTGNTIWFRLPNITALADAKTYLASNPLQVCYELANPQTYQLTPTEVKMLLGENNVWADSGDVEVVYVRDLNIAINNLLNSNGTRSLGMMAMSAPTETTAEEPTEEQSDEDMR